MPDVAIAAPNEAAADAGEQIALAGGNAVDAAVAAVLVTMVNEVGLVSLSSGGFVTVQPPDGGPPQTVDGWMDMPGRGQALGGGTWDTDTEYGGGVRVTIGPGSVAAHGSVAALEETHRRWGSVPWRELVTPAIEVARQGFHMSSASRYYLDHVHQTIFGWDEESRTAVHDAEGEIETGLIVVPDLAASLELIAADGASALHTGELARLISADVVRRGGILGAQDLADYRPVVRPSLVARAGDWTFGTNPPPSVGGVCVAAMLRLLDGRPRGDWEPEDVQHIIDVQRAVLGHRLSVLDHTDDLERDAAAFLDLVDRDDLALLESGSTAHVSTTDSDGGACAVTVSSGYSSGMIAQGTGIWLNNCLGEPELNARGLHGLAPGTRLLSNMAPTVGQHVDGSAMAIGSPGADRITTAIVQTLAGFVNGGLGLQDAVNHRRVHVHRAGRPDEVVRTETDLTMYYGGVGATLRRPDGHLVAAADPRRDGAVRLVHGPAPTMPG
ncbi:gamma-glutamyltransferase [Aeromicrobium sp. SMF47]|uniref:Gamma-glutamyltransferase n=1 Tax=Aeromicrobium yanjiei TaxID=2662028 RepID=A0A5Q2MQE5_9ACTN|nr:MULTISPECIES: gamma-glutamyltransferase [Aeromicrobium]MRJ76319.1 gamma-glutamyltransferase [Aeromicrobium yanjiei]MRK00670.1 gamma-glutamyltransferase [Aeromicrobium sp. S22]QGG42500.1 gamma-glutamyltransferase [Aeromicrobium yanjiei]